MTNTPINWPAIAVVGTSAELEILQDPQELIELLTPVNKLIDSQGNVYQPDNLTASITLTTVNEILPTIKEHLATMEHCCVSKFNARSIAEVIEILVSLDEGEGELE